MTKKIFLLFTIFFLFAFSSFSNSKKINFSVTPYSGFTFGSVGEYLYSSDDSFIISELDWNEKLFNVGLDANIEYKNFYFGIDFLYFIPSKNGSMFDSDFLKNQKEVYKANYCIFQNTSILSLDADAKLGYKIQIKKIKLIPEARFRYSTRNFKAINGYGWFGDSSITGRNDDYEWDSPFSRYAYKVSDIQYRRDTFYTFLGLQVEIDFCNFEISFGIFTSPFTKTLYSDHHLDQKKNTDGYRVYGSQESFFTRHFATLNIKYNFTNHVAIFVNISALFGTKDKGDFFTNYGRTGESFGIFKDQDQFYKSIQKSASDIKELTIKTGIVISF